MHLTVISIVDTTIWSIVNRALANLPDPFQIIGELWGCQEELIGYGGPHTHNVTPIFIYNTGARCGRPVMKLHIPTRYTIVYNGQQAGSTSGALMPIHAGHSYQSPDVILLPAAEDIINDIRAESNDAERWHPNWSSIWRTKSGLKMFRTEASKVEYQKAAISSSHPTLCSWSHRRLRAELAGWWGCGSAMWARSHCESSCYGLFGQ